MNDWLYGAIEVSVSYLTLNRSSVACSLTTNSPRSAITEPTTTSRLQRPPQALTPTGQVTYR